MPLIIVSSLPKSNNIILKKTESGSQQIQCKNITFKQTITIPCEIRHFDSKPWVIPTSTGTKQTEGLSCKVHQTCTGTKKTHVLNFKSAPNLHRDKKNKTFELQSAPNLHRDKKIPKKTKTSQSTWEGATIPLKFLFLFFLVPVQVWCTLKFKTFVFLSLCRFGALWSSKLGYFLSLCRL